MNARHVTILGLSLILAPALLGCDSPSGGTTGGSTSSTGPEDTGEDTLPPAPGTSTGDLPNETVSSGSGGGSEGSGSSGPPDLDPGWCWEPNHLEYPCECDVDGETMECTTDEGASGVAVCVKLDYKEVADGFMYSECGQCGPTDQQACEAFEGGVQFCARSETYAPPRPGPYTWGPCQDPATMECEPGELVDCAGEDEVCELDSDGVPRSPC